MIMIIEGPDGAGKTTFAKGIVGASYHHEGPPPAGWHSLLGYYYDKVLRTAYANAAEPVVFDRLAAGEVVYGPVLRGTTRLTTADYAAFVDMTKLHGAIHVMCLPPKAVAHLNWKRRCATGGELFEQEDLFSRTYDAFAALAEYADVVYDYTAGEAR
jgi:hypothetical protein